MPYILLLARRFLFKKKGSTLIASTAVAATIFLSIFTGVIFTGVKAGFIEEIADYQIGHVLIYNDRGLISTEDTHKISLLLKTNPLVVEGTPRLTTNTDINFTVSKGTPKHFGISTFGIDPNLEQKASKIATAVTQGSFIKYPTDIVLGSEIMSKAGAEIGSIVTLKVSRGGIDLTRKLIIVGVSEMGGFQGFTESAIVHIKTLRDLMGLDSESGHFIVRLSDVSRTDDVSEWLYTKLLKLDSKDDARFRVEPLEVNVKELITTFDQLIAFINLIGFVGMSAAALGIIVVLIMMVSGKTRDIGLLRAIGVKKKNIVLLFILNGAIIGLLGALAGGLGGTIAIIYLQHNPVAFFGGITPIVTFSYTQLLQPMILGFSISVLSSIYPAWKASRYLPAEAMRYF